MRENSYKINIQSLVQKALRLILSDHICVVQKAKRMQKVMDLPSARLS